MKITIMLFARARDLVGSGGATLEVKSDATIACLRRRLLEDHPALRTSGMTLLWAVNGQYAAADKRIQCDDDVACFPPVSGG
jgi:molybdopterin converting factor small subunit